MHTFGFDCPYSEEIGRNDFLKIDVTFKLNYSNHFCTVLTNYSGENTCRLIWWEDSQ
jgi:hypothetical protein